MGEGIGMFSWDQMLETIVAYALAALVIERALYQVFDTRAWRYAEEQLAEVVGGDFVDFKPWISVLVSVTVTWELELDMLAFLFGREPRPLSIVLTGLFIAGGSTGVYKFFKRARMLKDAKSEATIRAAVMGSTGNPSSSRGVGPACGDPNPGDPPTA